MSAIYSTLRNLTLGASAAICLASCSLICPGGIDTAQDEKHIAEFHDAISSPSENILHQDDLSLFVDYSTCIAEGQHSAFYKQLVPSWVNATKKYYSIKGSKISEESLSDSSTYTRLLSVNEVNYADLKTAVKMMSESQSESVLLTDGEYYNPTIDSAGANNPYMADALKVWLKKGHDVFVIAEPYIEQNHGNSYHKNRFYFLFTDTRLKNNIYDRVRQTVDFKNFDSVNIFHLSADHPDVFSGGETAGLSSQPNPTLAATVTPGNGYEIQDWTVTWDVISDYIMGASNPKTGEPLPMGDYVVKNLSINRLSFGGYVIKDVDIKVSDLNVAYTDFYNSCKFKTKPVAITELPDCPNFMQLDKKELNKGGGLKLHFDVIGFNPTFLKGKPYNYFKIDFFITKTENAFDNIEKWFSFDLLGQPGQTNLSVVASIKQCLTDKDLQNQMKQSPFYTIYIKSNKY